MSYVVPANIYSTLVYVNLARLECWGGIVVFPGQLYMDSEWKSSTSLSRCATVSARPTPGDRTPSGRLSSTGHPAWASAISSIGDSLPQQPGPSRALLRGVPLCVPSKITSVRRSESVVTRLPALRFYWVGCGIVDRNVLCPNRPNPLPLVLSADLRSISESGDHDRPCPPHRSITLSASVRSPSEVKRPKSNVSVGKIPEDSGLRLYRPTVTPAGGPSLFLGLPISSCFFSLLVSLLIRTPIRSVSF